LSPWVLLEDAGRLTGRLAQNDDGPEGSAPEAGAQNPHGGVIAEAVGTTISADSSASPTRIGPAGSPITASPVMIRRSQS
jgi:hypothetical protein